MKRFLPALLLALLLSPLLHAQSLIPFRDGTRWGYCNTEGKIILPCIYNNAFPFTTTGAVVVLDNKYGLIDTKGKWMIPASFDSLGAFNNGMAVFKKEGKFGLTDKTGKMTVPAEYKKIELQKSGFFLLSNGEYINGLANKNGELLLPAEYKEVSDFREGRLLVQKKSTDPWTILDEKGNTVFNMKYGEGFFDNNAKYFSQGVLHYRTFSPNAGGGLYDRNGKMLIYIPDACCYNKEERILRGMYYKGLFPATRSGEINDTLPDGSISKLKYANGYSDSSGQFILKPVYIDAGEFMNGVALVRRTSGIGLIDTTGREVIPLKYWLGRKLSDNRLLFRDKLKAYLYDTKGKLLMEYSSLKNENYGPLQLGMSNYREGVAIVKFEEGQQGFVDSMGRLISPMRFSNGTEFRDGLALVTMDEETSYINKKGQLFYRRKVMPVGRQQWDYQDLNTRVFANGDSIYKAISITDFIQKGLEKKPAFYHVSYIPNTQSKTRLLYNWYAVIDPRGLAPAGWAIPTEEEFMQLKKAGCSDSVSSDILYALGFDNGGQVLLKETGLGTRADGSWWTKTHQPNQNDEARVIFLRVNKTDQKSSLGFAVYPLYTGFAVRCIRKPEPVKPGIKLPAIPTLNCDSLLAITKTKVKPVKPVEKKTAPTSADYLTQMTGSYKNFTCVLSAGKEVTFTNSSVVSSHFLVEKVVAGYIKIDFEFRVNNTEGGNFFLQFVMQAGEASRTGTGAATRTTIPLYKVEGKADPYKPGVPYYRGENVRGAYCPETRTITIYGDMIKMYNSNEVSRTKYRITGVK